LQFQQLLHNDQHKYDPSHESKAKKTNSRDKGLTVNLVCLHDAA